MRKKSEYCNIPLNRMSNQCIWFYTLPPEISKPEEEFDNGVFVVRPYYWGEEEEKNDYHFYHRPSGFKMAWYKYPLRGVEANMEVTAEEFYAIVQDCANSISGSMSYLTFPRWWEDHEKEEENLSNNIVDDIAEEKEEFDVVKYIEEEGYEDVVIFDNPSYNNAFIGITTDFRAVYDYDKMIDCLLEEYPFWDEQEAIDYIEYNSIRATEYVKDGPIVIVSK